MNDVGGISTLQRGVPPTQGPFLALALTRGHREPFDLWHVGVLYRVGDGDELRLVEMLGDQLCRDVMALSADVGLLQRYAWAPLPLSLADTQDVIQLCRTAGTWIRSHGATMRLSFVYQGGSFDAATGALRSAAGESGLYCASAVLALFLGAAIDLLDRAGWPHTSEMDTWVEGFARMLAAAGEVGWCTRVLQQRPCVVFHPLDVMSVCLAGHIGVDAGTARGLSATVAAQYDGLFSNALR